jgi:hypothetical protein
MKDIADNITEEIAKFGYTIKMQFPLRSDIHNEPSIQQRKSSIGRRHVGLRKSGEKRGEEEGSLTDERNVIAQ